VRYLIKFTKESDIKFISHLDLMRTIQRIVRRAELPVEYSKGFNPHMSISIAQPLSVGMYSKGEYMDLVLTEEFNEELIKEKLNANVPAGIKFIEVVKIKNVEGEKKLPQAMALIDAAEYKINIKYDDCKKLVDQIEALKNKEQWNTIKRSKNGEKEVDIKPLIKNFVYNETAVGLEIKVLIACGSKENLSADLLASYIKNNTDNFKADAFVDIEREEMFIIKNDKFVPLYKCIE
jgi:radical SAM-linked protein